MYNSRLQLLTVTLKRTITSDTTGHSRGGRKEVNLKKKKKTDGVKGWNLAREWMCGPSFVSVCVESPLLVNFLNICNNNFGFYRIALRQHVKKPNKYVFVFWLFSEDFDFSLTIQNSELLLKLFYSLPRSKAPTKKVRILRLSQTSVEKKKIQILRTKSEL